MGLFEDIFSGTLTATAVNAHIGHNDINEVHPQKKVTPLVAAVFSGHASVVKILLEEGKADANTPSADGQSPLSWAASTTRRDRAKIVSLLLDKKADVDATCAPVRGETPLMLVMNESWDPDVIRLLVEGGASLTAISKKGETAEDIARKINSPAVNAALYPSKSRLDYGELVKMIVGLLGVIIAWVNDQTVNKVVQGVTKEMNEVVKKMHEISGERDEELEKKIWDKEPRTAAEFKQSIDSFVTKTGLDTFFSGPNVRFLQKVAEKASDLLNDPMDPMSKPENVKNLLQASVYQTVIYCDDSGFMLGPRAEAQAALVERITRIATRLLPDGEGIELRLINHGDDNGAGFSRLQAEDVRAAMAAVPVAQGNYAQIGTGLVNKILKPLVYDVLRAKQRPKRPLLVCIITDGFPENPRFHDVAVVRDKAAGTSPVPRSRETYDTTKTAIYQCGNMPEEYDLPRNAVLFQVNQIGNDFRAEEFLQSLVKDTRISDQLHITAEKLDDKWVDLRDNERHLDEWLLHTLYAPITEGGSAD